MKTTLYLDFDGVLHPDAVYRGKHGLELRAPGELFMHAQILVSLLSAYPEVEIVLSTSWVRELGYDRTLSRMPLALRERVVGATWHRHMKRDGYDPFTHMSRFEQIMAHVKRSTPESWLVLDDLHSDTESWPEAYSAHLIKCDSQLGLSDLEAATELLLKLRGILNSH